MNVHIRFFFLTLFFIASFKFFMYICHQELDPTLSVCLFIGFQTDMHVRDKVLILIGSWCEAFGGSRGKYPQYYMAYEDLRVNILAHHLILKVS